MCVPHPASGHSSNDVAFGDVGEEIGGLDDVEDGVGDVGGDEDAAGDWRVSVQTIRSQRGRTLSVDMVKYYVYRNKGETVNTIYLVCQKTSCTGTASVDQEMRAEGSTPATRSTPLTFMKWRRMR